VLGDFPSRLSSRARSIVRFSGMMSSVVPRLPARSSL
jgi:hypothetical protein